MIPRSDIAPYKGLPSNAQVRFGRVPNSPAEHNDMLPGLKVGNFAPNQRGTTLANWGGVVTNIGALMLLLAPLVDRKKLGWAVLKTAEKSAKRKAFEKVTWRILGAGMTLQGIFRYQTAVNTDQPSKLASWFTSTLQSIGMMLLPGNVLVRSTAFITSALIYAGERNDIENSNHPMQRREYSLAPLTRYFKTQQFDGLGGELKKTGRFIWQDLKLVFSTNPTLRREYLLPLLMRYFKIQAFDGLGGELKKTGQFIWQDLKLAFSTNPISTVDKAYKQAKQSKQSLLVPQSYQSAIGAQFSALTALLTWTGMALPKAPFAKGLKGIENICNVVGGLIPQIPLIVRAWQYKDEQEGRLVLLSAPALVFGRLFQVSPSRGYLSSFGFVGDTFKSKGLALNSQKYRLLLEELRHIHQQAMRDPSMTADGVLRELARPEIRKTLAGQLGKKRFAYFESIFIEALNQQNNKGVTLAQYLRPMIQTVNENA